MYYIQHNLTAMFWNQELEQWQTELTVICMGEYDECLKWAMINDLTLYEIKYDI